ncbi:type II toxin-antitoxin system HipA family toxin [Mitsuokella jalaludinii]|uniref:type II toxin-antitoxin system HipA family toxin n=1 Tax=Mitsuokella jalaludinii TaxID=187979 RepID=UPI003F8CBBF9
MIRNKTIFCYLDDSFHGRLYLGNLYVQNERGREICSFEWSDECLKREQSLPVLDPRLTAGMHGRQYAGDHLFGMLSDSCPDRWGRLLMTRRESIRAKQEGRRATRLLESDFLLGVHDEGRMGALRFKLDPDGPFLADDAALAAPPWTELRQLQDASLHFERDEGAESKWLSMLLAPGSSLGGARPKATVKDEEGNLWIAKFPSRHDEEDAGAWEMVAHDLAGLCHLHVPEARALRLTEEGTTFLVRRFDREHEKRVHMASAMTMLNQTDNAHDASYLDIVDWLTSNSTAPQEDLPELWKRMVFNVLISNTDDHLRNHGFLLLGDGWHLSPLYDVNPNPVGEYLSLGITEEDSFLDVGPALETAEFYQIQPREAGKTVIRMATVIRQNWKRLARKYRIARNSVERMEPAFRAAMELGRPESTK